MDLWSAPRARGPVVAEVALPGSKSITNRALILAALADGPSVVHGALISRDSQLMAQALRALGARIEADGTDWSVTPIGSSPGNATGASIDVGLAGTVMRFVPPVAALLDIPVSFDGDEHMRNRPIGSMLDALRDLGVEVDGDSLPFTIRGTGAVRGGQVAIDASSTSQFVSALLLAGTRFTDGLEIEHVGSTIPSQPHIDMTVEMLRAHGVDVTLAPNRWAVAPGTIKAVDSYVEPDLSNAAPFVGLAALTGGTVTVRDWPRATTQAGDRLRDLLTQMGCTAAFTDAGLSVSGPDQLLGLDADLHDVGELAPALAALCALASTPSHLRGIEHIRGHETDRLAALAPSAFNSCANVVEHRDGLTITPAPLHGGVFHTYADHRMAHAGVLIGAAVDGIEVENIATTSKTFTDFAPFWARLF